MDRLDTIAERLESVRLECDSCNSFSSLCLLVKRLAARTLDLVEEIRGDTDQAAVEEAAREPEPQPLGVFFATFDGLPALGHQGVDAFSLTYYDNDGDGCDLSDAGRVEDYTDYWCGKVSDIQWHKEA